MIGSSTTPLPEQSAQVDPYVAPDPLEVVRCFANTIDIEDRRDDLVKPDDLASPEPLRRWLLDHDLISRRERVTQEDLERAIELRGAIRALALANHGEAPPADALRTLDSAAERARLTPRFQAAGRPVLSPEGRGVEAALGRLVAIVFGSMFEDTWRRLKICNSDTCAWVFYDNSKNQSRAWCSMRICGNRAKARSYRRRATAADRSSG